MDINRNVPLIIIIVVICFELMVLTGCVFVLFGFNVPLYQPGLALSQKERVQFLPQIGLIVGVLVASVTIYMQFLQLRKQESRLLMQQIEGLLADVLGIAQRKSNNRKDWLSAELSLIRVENLGSKIKDSLYKNEFKSVIEKSRDDLYEALQISDEKTGEYEPLPGQFFYGIPDWREAIDLEDAYNRSKPSRLSGKGGSLLRRKKGRIERQSIIIVYNFADPGKTAKASDVLIIDKDCKSFLDRKDSFTQGAREYLKDASERNAL